MKFFLPGSNRQVNVNVMKNLIDWDRVVSKPQKKVKDFLKRYWVGHVVLEELVVPGTRWRMDLINLTRKIALEVSPDQHQHFTPFFHQNRFKFGASIQRDIKKEEWAIKNGFTFVEIYGEDIPNLSKEWFEKEYGITL
jgi:pyruvate-formate lyase-activating enzyme